MKRNIILSAITGAALLLLTASCSNTDENNEQKEPAQTVQFSFTNEDFGEDETPSRATSAAEAKPQTIDLGDCEAEITIENEPAAKKTRGAQTPANGHYTIRAYQAGVLKGEIKGTFSGGTFTPDGGSQKNFILPHGTYDFVAFNDQVTVSGNELKVDRADVETARIGLTTVSITGNGRTLVPFSMKHVGCRLRTQFVCKKDIPNNITATLEATATNAIPTSVTYDPATKTYTGVGGAMTPKQNNSPASTEAKYTASNYGENYSYTSSSDYHYFLPTTEGSKLKLTGISAGTVFWKPIPAFNVSQLNATLQMQPNKSYVVKIKLKPQYTYLMSDGTTGYFKDTTFGGAPAATAKTPIALVLDKDQHMAIALNKAAGGAFMNWCTSTYWYTQTNTHSVADLINDTFGSQPTSGIDETWNASYTTNNVTGEKVKGNNPDFLPFYAAAHYDPGVPYTGTPALQWYLPSCSDWTNILPLGFSVIGASDADYRTYTCYGNLLNIAFTQVGSDEFARDNYWASSERSFFAGGDMSTWKTYMHFTNGNNKKGNRFVYAFVKY